MVNAKDQTCFKSGPWHKISLVLGIDSTGGERSSSHHVAGTL